MSTRLYFSNTESANNYLKGLNNRFLLNKAKMLEYPNSKRKTKIINFSQQNKYLLTKQGGKLLLWEKVK